MNEIIRLKPVFSHTIWGGCGLKDRFGYNEAGNDIGECWGIAAHPHGDCEIESGEYKGRKLSWLYKEHPELFGIHSKADFPLLIKIIDAKDNLSIQVHPDDKYALINENGSMGKTECWYIIDCPQEAYLVIGHNARTKEELSKMIQEQNWDRFIRKVPVKKGDFIQIEPGTVHAITAGCMILETQQNCDITYRVYDYDRIYNGQKRELHIDKSIDVINVPYQPEKNSIVSYANIKSDTLITMKKCSCYNVYILKSDKGCIIKNSESFYNVSVIEGNGTINGEEVSKGNHLIITKNCSNIAVTGNMLLIISEPVNY